MRPTSTVLSGTVDEVVPSLSRLSAAGLPWSFQHDNWSSTLGAPAEGKVRLRHLETFCSWKNIYYSEPMWVHIVYNTASTGRGNIGPTPCYTMIQATRGHDICFKPATVVICLRCLIVSDNNIAEKQLIEMFGLILRCIRPLSI